MSSQAGLDWPALLRLGLGELRLTPQVFWDLTPIELMIMAGKNPRASQILTRSDLRALAQRYPDKDLLRTENG